MTFAVQRLEQVRTSHVAQKNLLVLLSHAKYLSVLKVHVLNINSSTWNNRK